MFLIYHSELFFPGYLKKNPRARALVDRQPTNFKCFRLVKSDVVNLAIFWYVQQKSIILVSRYLFVEYVWKLHLFFKKKNLGFIGYFIKTMLKWILLRLVSSAPTPRSTIFLDCSFPSLSLSPTITFPWGHFIEVSCFFDLFFSCYICLFFAQNRRFLMIFSCLNKKTRNINFFLYLFSKIIIFT